MSEDFAKITVNIQINIWIGRDLNPRHLAEWVNACRSLLLLSICEHSIAHFAQAFSKSLFQAELPTHVKFSDLLYLLS